MKSRWPKWVLGMMGFLFWVLPQGLQAQGGIPLTLPLFLNDDGTCQSEDVVQFSYTATCGTMTDDTADGNASFPDCVNITESRIFLELVELTQPQASFIENQNLHNSDACPKDQMMVPETIELTVPTTAVLSGTFLGSVRNANFDGGNFSDFVYPRIPIDTGAVAIPAVEEWPSLAGGGFDLLGDLSTTYPRQVDLSGTVIDLVTPFRTNPFAMGSAGTRCADNSANPVLACPSDKNNVVLDCNADGLPDLSTAVFGNTAAGALFGVYLHTLVNTGGDLQAPPISDLIFDLSPPFPTPQEVTASVATADFNSDGNPDVMAAVDVTANGTPTNQLVLCSHDASATSCGFNCTSVLDLATVVTDANFSMGGVGAGPFSTMAGDFDGDGFQDVALSLIGVTNGGNLLSRVLYLFGDGAGNFSAANSLQVSTAFTSVGGSTPLLSVGGAAMTDVVPTSMATGHFDNDDILDLALTNFHAAPGLGGTNSDRFSVNQPQGFVLVLRSDGTSGVNFSPTATPLEFPVQDLTLVQSGGDVAIQAPYDRSSGIASADFDHCGGDDLIALADSCPGGLIDQISNSGTTFGECVADPAVGNFIFAGQREAVVFLNANEAPVITVDPNFSDNLPVNVATNLTVSCEDPTNDDRTFQWNALTVPAGATVVFGTPSGSLTGAELDASTTVSADVEGDYTVEIVCTDFCGLSSSQQISFVVTETGNFTQGANFCRLNPSASSKGSGMIWFLILLMPLLYGLRRFGRSAWVGLALLLILGMPSPTHALTTSVSVNTFAPTMDDSEYFTVYGSPTMLQRNFHVGFFLDYAHNPYEFGDDDFDRVSGIVDHLLTGNIVGSYGILDWFNAGLVIPVHLYEGLKSPLLGLDESNFALGDITLLLKFRLLDREKYGVGIAIIPFISFPTSTNSGDFLGNGSFRGGGQLVIDGRIADRVSIALNVGYNARDRFFDVGGNDLDDQFLASLGLSVDILKETLKVIGEVQTATVVRNFYSDRRTTPAEARVGFRYTWARNHDINGGVGLGFLNGIGQPDIRGFVGYTYTKRPIKDVTIPEPPMSEVSVGDELTLKDKIYFNFDKSTIRDISKPTLDKIAGFLKAHPEVTKIKIDGYTCDLGSERYNLGLSQRRAKSVARYLEGQDISPDRIGTVAGFGESNPLVPNTDEANREQNRRVQIFVEAVAN